MIEDFAAALREYEGRTWGPLTLDRVTYSAGTIRYEYTLSGERHVEEEILQGRPEASLYWQIEWWLSLWLAHLDERGLL